MRINTNISALNAHRQLGINTERGAGAMEKLSSGLRINRAGDDAAGLAISEKMRGQIRGLTQASRNAQDGISLIQTAEGALNETHSILQRMRELATQSATDTNTLVDRAEIQKEIDQLAEELTRIADNTEFNTQNLLGGEFRATFHIGANEAQNIKLEINAMGAKALEVAGEGKLGEDITILTASESGEVHGVESQSVLKVAGESNGDVVAVKVGDEWYAPEDVAAKDGEDNGTVLVVDKDAKPLTVIEGWTKDSEFFIEGKAAVLGLAGQDVLFDVDGEIAYVKAWKSGGDSEEGYYALTDVEVKDGALVAKTEAAAVTLGSDPAYVIGEPSGINVSTQEAADGAITTINDAIETVSAERSKLGAMQNRLEHTIANLGTSAENLQAAESRIRDLDMAAEIMEFTKSNILNQAATAMLAQANMAPQTVLQLLG